MTGHGFDRNNNDHFAVCGGGLNRRQHARQCQASMDSYYNTTAGSTRIPRQEAEAAAAAAAAAAAHDDEGRKHTAHARQRKDINQAQNKTTTPQDETRHDSQDRH